VGTGPFDASVVAPPPLGEGLTYDEFKAFVRELAQRDDLTAHGLLPIPTLRRESASRIARADLDAFLVRMHGDGEIHLLTHVEFESLSASLQQDCLRLPSGQDLYWIRSL
jgi:hypothetical protein